MVTPPTLAQACTEVLARNCSCLAELRGAELFAEQLEVIFRGMQAHDLRRLARCNGFPTIEPTEDSELSDDAGCVHDSGLAAACTGMGEARWCGNAPDRMLSASMRYELSVALEHRWKQLYLARLRHTSLNPDPGREKTDHPDVDLPPEMGSWSAAYAYQEGETWRQMRIARERLRQRRAQAEQERVTKRIRSLPVVAVASVRAALIERQSERLGSADHVACAPKRKSGGTSVQARLLARFRCRSRLLRRLPG